MKPFTQYLQEMNKLYEFHIKIAGCDVTKEITDKIKSALSAYAVESVSTPKRLPVQEHVDFPTLGPCECHMFEVAVKYPVVSDQIAQTVAEKLALPRNSILVRTKNEDLLRSEHITTKKDSSGAILTQPDLEDIPDSQELVGEKRRDNMLKDLESRKYDFAAKDFERAPTEKLTPGTVSPVGSRQNAIPTITRKK